MFISLLQKLKSTHKQSVRKQLGIEPDSSLNSNWTKSSYHQSCKEIIDITKNDSTEAIDYILSVSRLPIENNLREDYRILLKSLIDQLRKQKRKNVNSSNLSEVSEHVYEM